jgi:hypothetical protein
MKKSKEYLKSLISEASKFDDKMFELENQINKQKMFKVGQGFWEFHLNNLKKLIEEESRGI